MDRCTDLDLDLDLIVQGEHGSMRGQLYRGKKKQTRMEDTDCT